MPITGDAMVPSATGPNSPNNADDAFVIDDEFILTFALDVFVREEALLVATADEEDPLNEDEMLEP